MRARSIRRTGASVPLLARSPIILSSLLLSSELALAAPPELICADDDSKNCFRDDVFVLDGNESVMRNGMAVPLVGCSSSEDCYLNSPDDSFRSEGLTAAVLRALTLMRMTVPALPAWDEVLVFTADFGPDDQPAPLFYRANDAAGIAVNRVTNIGLGGLVEPDADKPFLGIIDGGNVGGLGATPTTAVYNQCGRLPPRTIDPPLAQPIGAICAPGVYSYFDALAQATAALYGPYVTGGDSAGSLVTLPIIKTALVSADGTPNFPTNGPAINVWNAFLDTGGSLLGGNTWRDNGNGTFETARPPAFYGVSAPYEARQVLRFQPLDLYLLGFAPSSEVEALRTFNSATLADLYLPVGLDEFDETAGPAMGTRVGGVVFRSKSGFPRSITIEDIVAANGARVPAVDAAPQQIRQLWIVVTKPDALRDQIATEAGESALEDDADADVQAAVDESLEAQAAEQEAQIEDIQRFRRQYNQHFYTLAGYRGRVVTTFEGNVDDLSYWEFADPPDEAPLFVANGGIELAMNGLEPVPNAAGARQSVLGVRTPGEGGSITYTAPADRALRIQGSSDIQGRNNVFSARMRLPKDPALAGRLKARLVLDGPDGRYEVTIPSHAEAYLVPDGRFRNYTVLLSDTLSVQPIVPEVPMAGEEGDEPEEDPETEEVVSEENTDFTGKDYTTFTFTPANAEVSGIDIEFLKIGNSTDVADVDEDCDGKLQLDGFLGADDNCPTVFNPDQLDGNSDGIGDACEDFDGDVIINGCDNCPGHGNGGQQDANANGIGDACDPGADDGCEVSSGGAPSQRGELLALVSAAALALSRRRSRHRPGEE